MSRPDPTWYGNVIRSYVAWLIAVALAVVREAVGQASEGGAELHAGHLGADAAVHAVAEG